MNKNEKTFAVTLKNIVWDTEIEPGVNSKVVLPSSVTVVVTAFDELGALEYALDKASDDYGFLIQGSEPKIKKLKL
jgi:hypothetical protein